MGDNSSAGSMMRQSSPSFAFRKYPRAWRGAIWPDLGTRARFVSADLSPEAGPSYVLQRTFPEPTPPWACHQVPMKLKAWADTPPAKLPRPPGMIGEEGSHIECMPIMRSEDVAKGHDVIVMVLGAPLKVARSWKGHVSVMDAYGRTLAGILILHRNQLTNDKGCLVEDDGVRHKWACKEAENYIYVYKNEDGSLVPTDTPPASSSTAAHRPATVISVPSKSSQRSSSTGYKARKLRASSAMTADRSRDGKGSSKPQHAHMIPVNASTESNSRRQGAGERVRPQSSPPQSRMSRQEVPSSSNTQLKVFEKFLGDNGAASGKDRGSKRKARPMIAAALSPSKKANQHGNIRQAQGRAKMKHIERIKNPTKVIENAHKDRMDIDGGPILKPFSIEGEMFLPLKTQNLGTSEELSCRVQYVKILRTLQDTQSVIKKERILMQGSITRKEHHTAKLKESEEQLAEIVKEKEAVEAERRPWELRVGFLEGQIQVRIDSKRDVSLMMRRELEEERKKVAGFDGALKEVTMRLKKQTRLVKEAGRNHEAAVAEHQASSATVIEKHLDRARLRNALREVQKAVSKLDATLLDDMRPTSPDDSNSLSVRINPPKELYDAARNLIESQQQSQNPEGAKRKPKVLRDVEESGAGGEHAHLSCIENGENIHPKGEAVHHASPQGLSRLRQKSERMLAKIMGGKNEDGDTDSEEGTDDEEQQGGDATAWKRDPLVFMRRMKMIVAATSPRWKKRLADEASEWAHLAYLAEKVARKELPQLGDEDDEEEKVGEKDPATKKYLDMKALSKRYGEGFFEMMSEGVQKVWTEEFKERLFGEIEKHKKHANYRKIWNNAGLPSDLKTDEVRQREVSWDKQFPSPDADMEAFRDQMKGKWNDLLKTFHMIDQDKNGTLDFKEFQRGCKLMGLGMSNFQVHRLFTAVAGSENCIYYEQFLDKFQPPQPDLNSAMLLHNSVPFLRGGPEETTREIIRRSKSLSFKAGNRIYRIGDPGSEMWFVTSGAVRLQDIKGKELAVLRPGEIFGVEGVIHGDAGEGFMSARAPSASHLNPLAEKSSEEDCKRLACQQIPMAPPYSLCVCGPRRRESAFASEDCDLLCLTRDELETMFRRHTALKDRVYRCSWFWQSEARATSNGAKPKYPDSRLFNFASVSERGTGRVVARRSRPEPRLEPAQGIRIKDGLRLENWTSLEMESSFNEHGPGRTRVPRGKRTLPPMGGGIEAVRTYDDEPDPRMRSLKIQETFNTKFARLKALRRHGEMKVDQALNNMR